MGTFGRSKSLAHCGSLGLQFRLIYCTLLSSLLLTPLGNLVFVSLFVCVYVCVLSISSLLYFLFFSTFLCQLSKFFVDKMSARLLLAVFRLEKTTSLAAAGDFACPPPTRPRRPKQLPLACTCAARSPVVRPPPRARPPPRKRPGRSPRPFPRPPAAGEAVMLVSVLFIDFLKDSLRTVLGRLRLADVDDTSSGTMDVNKFLPSSLATSTTYFFMSGMATRPIRIANAPIHPPNPNCRAGLP